MDTRLFRNNKIKESTNNVSVVKEIQVSAKDLPLHCPTAAVAAWSSHPRVFLDITKTGLVSCPYCGTKYQLKAGEIASNQH